MTPYDGGVVGPRRLRWRRTKKFCGGGPVWSGGNLIRPIGCVGAVVAGILLSGSALAGTVLDGVKAQDRLRCGISEGIPGFSVQRDDGVWAGFDVDFCHAVAAAVLGDAAKVEFVPLKASERFPALRLGSVDLLVRNATWTLAREALLQVQFPAVLFFDGQGFMVPASAGIHSVADLDGGTVCIEKGTRHEKNLLDYFRVRNLAVTPMVFESVTETAAAFFAGQCDAYTSDASQLAAVRLRAPGDQQAFTILDERISKEPLGPVVSALDPQWFLVVRWVLFSLLEAEERGYTGADVRRQVGQDRMLSMRALSDHDAALVEESLGVSAGALINSIEAVGNYGEMYERHFGPGSAIPIDRGLNRLWNAGGLMFAPPIN